MRMERMLVTPELAAGWLATRTPRQRSLRPSHVRWFVEILTRGEWLVTHEGVALSLAGELLDGQHRLAAIAKSGIAAEMLVFFDVPEEAYRVMGDGLRRTVADHLSIDKRIAEPK